MKNIIFPFIISTVFIVTIILATQNPVTSDQNINFEQLLSISSVNAEEVWDCNAPTDDQCVFEITASMDLGILADLLNVNQSSLSIGLEVNLTNATQLYSKGGTYRCGEDITCNDLLNDL